MDQIEINITDEDKQSEVLFEATPEKIVIKSHPNSYVFEKNSYVEEYISHLINRKEWQEFILEANKQMGIGYYFKRISDEVKFPKYLVMSSLFAFILFLVFFLTLYNASLRDSDATYLFIIACICVSISAIITLYVLTYNFKRKMQEFKLLDDYMKESVDAYLDKLNRKWDGSLKFVYLQKPKWIECNILKVKNLGDSEDNKYMANNEQKRLVNDKRSQILKNIERKKISMYT